jgi:hypothetical protein
MYKGTGGPHFIVKTSADVFQEAITLSDIPRNPEETKDNPIEEVKVGSFTRARKRRVLGFYYKEVLRIQEKDFGSGDVDDYHALQTGDTESDYSKAQRLDEFSNTGYKIYYYPRKHFVQLDGNGELVSLGKQKYEIEVFVRAKDRVVRTSRADACDLIIEGIDPISGKWINEVAALVTNLITDGGDLLITDGGDYLITD